MFEPERLPPRNSEGYTAHPDLPDWGENEDGEPVLAAIGYEGSWITLDCHLDQKEAERISETGDHASWQPEPPEGDGWLLAAIYDHEDGPYALYVRPNAEVQP